MWRRHARAPEAVAARPVIRPLPHWWRRASQSPHPRRPEQAETGARADLGHLARGTPTLWPCRAARRWAAEASGGARLVPGGGRKRACLRLGLGLGLGLGLAAGSAPAPPWSTCTGRGSRSPPPPRGQVARSGARGSPASCPRRRARRRRVPRRRPVSDRRRASAPEAPAAGSAPRVRARVRARARGRVRVRVRVRVRNRAKARVRARVRARIRASSAPDGAAGRARHRARRGGGARRARARPP